MLFPSRSQQPLCAVVAGLHLENPNTSRIQIRVRVRVRTIFERRSGDRTRVDGVCDFKKVTVGVRVRMKVNSLGSNLDEPFGVVGEGDADARMPWLRSGLQSGLGLVSGS